MAFIIRTINGDTVDESTFEDCKYAVEVFTLLTVLRYRVKNLYEEADVVLYYNNISKLIKRDGDLRMPAEELRDATLVIHFRNRVPMAYVSTFQTNAMDYDVITQTRNVTPEYLDHSVQVPLVVIDNIRQQVMNMEESIKKIEEQQSKDDEKHIAVELSQLLEESPTVAEKKNQEKLAEIAHGYYYYKKYLAHKNSEKPVLKYGKCLKSFFEGTDDVVSSERCRGATCELERDNHILYIRLKTFQGQFPENHELVLYNESTATILGPVDLLGLFPIEGTTKTLRYFPLTQEISVNDDISVKVRNKSTGEQLLVGTGHINSKIHMHSDRESIYTPPVSRNDDTYSTDDIRENLSSVDLQDLQSETAKLYQEILKFETDNDAGKSIISEEGESVSRKDEGNGAGTGNWEDYDFLSDSSI
ncbi:hypothetical protein RNJ44_01913 [Nakaseomyces bracarensis]|uniref:Uncharacterized protein n=1 Tax=Nakaseomyces bracarensis TaxID=273131 RepID=A0ABR4NP65_9SACH